MNIGAFNRTARTLLGLRPPVGVSRLRSDLVGALGAHIDDVIFVGIKRREGFRIGGPNGI